MRRKHEKKKPNRSSYGGGGIVILVLIFILALVAGLAAYMTDCFGQCPDLFPQSATGILPNQLVLETGNPWEGTVTPSISHQDVLAASSSIGEGAQASTTWLRCIGMVGIQQNCGAGWDNIATGNGTWDARGDDNGVIFMEVSANTAATYYFAIKETKNTNGRIEQYAYVDWDNDDTKEHVLRLNFGSLRPTAGGSTGVTLGLTEKWYQFQAPTGQVQEPSAIATGIGTAPNGTQIYKYRISFANFDRSFLVERLEVELNNTDDTKWTLDKVTIPFQNIEFSFDAISADQVQNDGTNVTYVKLFARDLSAVEQNWLLVSRTGDQLYVDIEIRITWRMTSSDDITLGIRLTGWTDDETVSRIVVEIANHETQPTN